MKARVRLKQRTLKTNQKATFGGSGSDGLGLRRPSRLLWKRTSARQLPRRAAYPRCPAGRTDIQGLLVSSCLLTARMMGKRESTEEALLCLGFLPLSMQRFLPSPCSRRNLGMARSPSLANVAARRPTRERLPATARCLFVGWQPSSCRVLL